MGKWYSLYDKIYRMENLEGAFRQVKRNHGAPGIDGVTIETFEAKLSENLELIHSELKTKTYEPNPVRRVEIDKPDGGKRLLGVPTVKDRVVQQAVVTILEPIYDKGFHPSSYGYRKERSQAQAIEKATLLMRKYELIHVVDMDLSKCFDRLDHEFILNEMAKQVSDGSVLNLLRKFLKAGVLKDGQFEGTEIGSPQGGVISPLLSNVYLNVFDQEMMRRDIRIVRYADDILIFARTREQAESYLKLAVVILENDMKLTVNKEKTHLTKLYEGVEFLGVRISSKWISIQPKRLKKFRDKVRRITRRNSGRPLGAVVEELTPVLRGWINYYRVADIKSLVTDLMGWIRRRLRMIRMKQWKTYKAMHKELRRKDMKRHIKEKMDVRRWKNSKVHIIHMLMPNSYFDELGLYEMTKVKVGLLSHIVIETA
ncbi:MAG: group II intron reverse transcriptase/maturase [Clostridiaceae bacterium]